MILIVFIKVFDSSVASPVGAFYTSFGLTVTHMHDWQLPSSSSGKSSAFATRRSSKVCSGYFCRCFSLLSFFEGFKGVWCCWQAPEVRRGRCRRLCNHRLCRCLLYGQCWRGRRLLRRCRKPERIRHGASELVGSSACFHVHCLLEWV